MKTVITITEYRGKYPGYGFQIRFPEGPDEDGSGANFPTLVTAARGAVATLEAIELRTKQLRELETISSL